MVVEVAAAVFGAPQESEVMLSLLSTSKKKYLMNNLNSVNYSSACHQKKALCEASD